MDDRSCVELLRWALPRMGMRWKGFRKVRRQVCRRIRQRMEELDLRDVEAYRTVLRENPEEWDHLASLCRVTISRFRRDRGLWAEMEEVILPELAGGLATGRPLRAWSAGCASGEEPWTLAIVWHLEVGPRFPHNSLEVVATDVDPVVLARAQEGRYGPSSLRELDSRHRQAAFVEEPLPGGAQGESEGAGEGRFRLRDDLRGGVHFLQQDLTREMPAGPFQLILCRNLAFTYFDLARQRQVLSGFLARLEPGGALVVGSHETLPPGDPPLPLVPWGRSGMVYRRRP